MLTTYCNPIELDCLPLDRISLRQIAHSFRYSSANGEYLNETKNYRKLWHNMAVLCIRLMH